jgi:acylphosphatase
MNILARSLYAYRFLEVVNRVCLVPTGKFSIFSILHSSKLNCLILVSSLSSAAAAKSDTCTPLKGSLQACDFEVFGTVQGVDLRKYTKQQAAQLKIVGWVQNTIRDSVEGHMEGEKPNIDQMKNWLEKTGSPRSKITKVQFTNEKSITKLSGDTFDIKR